MSQTEHSTTEPNPADKSGDAAGDGAGRLVVLWLCWVLLAVFLGAVAVVDF